MYSLPLLIILATLPNLTSAQQNCPPETPKSYVIRFAWQHRWLRCENMQEGGCPTDLPGPYKNSTKDDCEKYLSESGDDFIIDYYVCEKEEKFDELKPILDKYGWFCIISE